MEWPWQCNSHIPSLGFSLIPCTVLPLLGLCRNGNGLDQITPCPGHRIIEWFTLQGTLKSISFPTLAMGRDNFLYPLLRATSSLMSQFLPLLFQVEWTAPKDSQPHGAAVLSPGRFWMICLFNNSKGINTSLHELLCCLFITSHLEYRWVGCRFNLDARTTEIQGESPPSSTSWPMET